MSRVALDVRSIGYAVARSEFLGRVHSVFERACNFECDAGLLTLVPPSGDDGPMTLVLGDDPPNDLRALFDIGEPVRCDAGRIEAGRVGLRLAGARTWYPVARRPFLPLPEIAAHLRIAAERLARHRRDHSSVIDREGAAVVAGLAQACRGLDDARALQHAARLIGWGEGLTPAGDDFLVGWMAALDALAHDDEKRRLHLEELARAIAARAMQTTPIAAHFLRLAAQGRYHAPLECLRDAVLSEPCRGRLDMALDRALDAGATSGADTVSGLLSGLNTWLPAAAGAP